MPMITTTIRSSIRVNPFLWCDIVGLLNQLAAARRCRLHLRDWAFYCFATGYNATILPKVGLTLTFCPIGSYGVCLKGLMTSKCRIMRGQIQYDWRSNMGVPVHKKRPQAVS